MRCSVRLLLRGHVRPRRSMAMKCPIVLDNVIRWMAVIYCCSWHLGPKRALGTWTGDIYNLPQHVFRKGRDRYNAAISFTIHVLLRSLLPAATLHIASGRATARPQCLTVRVTCIYTVLSTVNPCSRHGGSACVRASSMRHRWIQCTECGASPAQRPPQSWIHSVGTRRLHCWDREHYSLLLIKY